MGYSPWAHKRVGHNLVNKEQLVKGRWEKAGSGRY